MSGIQSSDDILVKNTRKKGFNYTVSSIAPDHKAIFLGMKLQSGLKRGPGTRKFNNTLSEDQDYIDLINFI